MKKFSFTLLLMTLFFTQNSNLHAQTLKPQRYAKISFSQYLLNSVNRILEIENLNECLGRSVEVRFVTSDCSGFLNELEFETKQIHHIAQDTFSHLKNESLRNRYAPYLNLYTEMVTNIHSLEQEYQNDFDKQNLVYSIRKVILKTKKDFIKLSNSSR
jgi:hypothetical protein